MVGDADDRNTRPGGNLDEQPRDTLEILLKVSLAIRSRTRDGTAEVDGDNHIEAILSLGAAGGNEGNSENHHFWIVLPAINETGFSVADRKPSSESTKLLRWRLNEQ